MDQLMERVDKVLSDHLEVTEKNDLWLVRVTESGITKTVEFPSLETADQFASTERLRLGKK